MTTRMKTITALVLAGAAVAASPVLAADVTAGYKGPAEVPTDRAAPIALPEITPMPLPQVSGEISRGLFDLDPTAALDALGTVTLSHDGSVVETPASDALRAAFEESMKGNAGD